MMKSGKLSTVVEHIGALHSMDDSLGSGPQSPPLLPDSALPGYRAAVDDLVQEVTRRPWASELADIERLVAKRVQEPELSDVLSHLDGGVDGAAACFIGEIGNYQHVAGNSASDLATFIRILLLSQIDSVWWSGTIPFTFEAEVLGSAELVDLGALKSARMLEFQYRAQPTGLLGRARDWGQHKMLPGLSPRIAGLRYTCSRPVVVAVANQIARDFAAAVPRRTPRIWVTSMVRSVEHQYHLRALGYAAVLPSAHCAGYACDLESGWSRQFDPDNVLASLLFERQEAGQLNVIDEGGIWHLCVNPNALNELQAAYDSQLGMR
jgi:hypothetical protein